jgi:flagellar motor switch protein FliG
MANELTGRQNAAVFLVSVGTEIASEIFKCLPEDEVETLTFEIARLESIDD